MISSLTMWLTLQMFPPLVMTKQLQVGLYACMWHNGTLYSRSLTHIGNSLVLYYANGDTSSEPVPALIKYIYHPCKCMFIFTVQHQLPVATQTLDPFQHYPDFPAKLYLSQLQDELELVKPEWIVAHFACWKISADHVVVLSLFKIGFSHLRYPNERCQLIPWD